MNRYEAFASKSWREAGIAQILVARISKSGRADIGFFLVDHWCLGVKDAYLVDDSTEADLREMLRDRLPEEFREPIHPACAKKMIEGAVAYAESLGFAPARDYRKAKRVLSGVTAAECPETFVYGRDGRPFYVEGPDDSPDRTARVLTLLTNRFGADGFDYELFSEIDDDENAGVEDDDVEDAREALRIFFESRDEVEPDFYEFAGMVAALQVCPTLVTPPQLIERLWGSDVLVWADEDDLADFMDDLRVYWNYIVNLFIICASPAGDDPQAHPIDISRRDFEETDENARISRALLAMTQWCRGFIRATQEFPEAWGDAVARADLAPHWAVIRAWADPDQPESLQIITGCETPDDPTASYDTGRLPRAVISLIRALRPSDFPKKN